MFLLILLLFLKVYVLSVFIVDGHSMESTLHDKDLILIDTWKYRYQPVERFDIVVFQRNNGAYFVKRVIGLPGEKVQFKERTLYINNEPINETYLTKEEYNLMVDFTLNMIQDGEVIPEGYYFLLGDHRSRSLDSRNFGIIHNKQLSGKVLARYYPTITWFN